MFFDRSQRYHPDCAQTMGCPAQLCSFYLSASQAGVDQEIQRQENSRSLSRSLACQQWTLCIRTDLVWLYTFPAGKVPLLDRSKLQCLDLGTANEGWIVEYQVDRSLLYFGGRHYSYTENSGYFMSAEGQVQAIRKNGKILGQWASFSRFLRDELREAETIEQKEPQHCYLR